MKAIDYSKIDEGIREEVRALNELDVETIACCSGHDETNSYFPYLVYRRNTIATTILSGILNNYKVGRDGGPFYFNRFTAIVRPYDGIGDTPSINLCCKDPSIENNKEFKKLLSEWILKIRENYKSQKDHVVRTKQEITDLVESTYLDETDRLKQLEIVNLRLFDLQVELENISQDILGDEYIDAITPGISQTLVDAQCRIVAKLIGVIRNPILFNASECRGVPDMKLSTLTPEVWGQIKQNMISIIDEEM